MSQKIGCEMMAVAIEEMAITSMVVDIMLTRIQ
jgi:hypothetical protein